MCSDIRDYNYLKIHLWLSSCVKHCVIVYFLTAMAYMSWEKNNSIHKISLDHFLQKFSIFISLTDSTLHQLCTCCFKLTVHRTEWVKRFRVSACVSLITKTALCRMRCYAHEGALTSPGSLRCSVQTSSPRRSRFLRSALALLRNTQTCTLAGRSSQRGDLSAL